MKSTSKNQRTFQQNNKRKTQGSYLPLTKPRFLCNQLGQFKYKYFSPHDKCLYSNMLALLRDKSRNVRRGFKLLWINTRVLHSVSTYSIYSIWFNTIYFSLNDHNIRQSHLFKWVVLHLLDCSSILKLYSQAEYWLFVSITISS